MINRTSVGKRWLFGIYLGVYRPWQCARTDCRRATFLIAIPGVGVHCGIR